MKTNHPSLRLLLTGSLVALAAGFPTLRAGPGIDYWTRQGQSDTTRAASASAGAPKPCIDAKSVAVYEYRNELPNGKGLAHYVQVGTKQVCTACATPFTTKVPSWPNGKGPLVAQTFASTHDCVTCAR